MANNGSSVWIKLLFGFLFLLITTVGASVSYVDRQSHARDEAQIKDLHKTSVQLRREIVNTQTKQMQSYNKVSNVLTEFKKDIQYIKEKVG